jgi:hypothetical protein
MPAISRIGQDIARMAASHKHPSRRPYEHHEGLWTGACISEVKRSEASHEDMQVPVHSPVLLKEGRRGDPDL